MVDQYENAQPCKYCAPIFALIERIAPPAPASVPASALAVEEVDDDIPF